MTPLLKGFNFLSCHPPPGPLYPKLLKVRVWKSAVLAVGLSSPVWSRQIHSGKHILVHIQLTVTLLVIFMQQKF